MKKFRVLKRLFLVCLLCAISIGVKADLGNYLLVECSLDECTFSGKTTPVSGTEKIFIGEIKGFRDGQELHYNGEPLVIEGIPVFTDVYNGGSIMMSIVFAHPSRIASNALAGCGMTSLALSRYIYQIGSGAFANCSNLKDIYVSWTNKTQQLDKLEINNNVGWDFNNCVLHVPVGTKAMYEADSYWGQFSQIVESQAFDPISDADNNIMFFGNQVTSAPKDETSWPIGSTDVWDPSKSRGMGASVNETDYVNIVLKGMYGGNKKDIMQQTVSPRNYFDIVSARTTTAYGYPLEGGFLDAYMNYLNDGNSNGRFQRMLTHNKGIPKYETDDLAMLQSKIVVYQLGQNYTNYTNPTDIAETSLSFYRYIKRFRTDMGERHGDYRTIVVYSTPTPTSEQALYWATAIQTANNEGCNVDLVDCVTEADKGKLKAGDYVLKDDGTPFKIVSGSAVLNMPSDVGMYGIAKKVLEEIYKNDATKKTTALNRIGTPKKIYYVGNGTNCAMSSNYEPDGNAYGEWIANGVVNVRVDFTNYTNFKNCFDHFKFTKRSDGTELTGTGYPYVVEWNGNVATVAFNCYDGDMNIEPIYKVELGDEVDGNQNKINLFVGTANPDVMLKRNTAAGVWNTICLPFKPTASQLKQMFGDGVEIQEFKEVTGGINLVFKAINLNDFQAGVPYIVKPTSEALKTGVTLENVTFTEKIAKNVTCLYGGNNYKFQGIYDPFAVTGEDQKESDVLFLSGGGLSYPQKNGDIKPFRCYFQISGQTVNLSRMNVVFGGETNAISSMPMSQEKQEMNMDRIFTIDGRFVGHSLKGLKKGLYIQNGKKIVID